MRNASIPAGRPVKVKRVIRKGWPAHRVSWANGEVRYITDEALVRSLNERKEEPECNENV